MSNLSHSPDSSAPPRPHIDKMRTDRNRAAQAAYYLNAQLLALHENARRISQEDDGERTEEKRQLYALAEFTVPRSTASSPSPSEAADSLLYASFAAPTLQFMCKHYVHLRLEVIKGHIATGSPDGGESVVIPLPEGLQITYRVGFSTRLIVDDQQKPGEYGSVVELVILDLHTAATPLSIEPAVSSGGDLLSVYLTRYLELLHSAGNHVLFSLPQLGQRATPEAINYSLIAQSDVCEEMESMHGVTAKEINKYLSASWLRSAMRVVTGSPAVTLANPEG